MLDALFPDLGTELERQMRRRAILNGGDAGPLPGPRPDPQVPL